MADLTPFDAVNKKSKVEWEERAKVIHEQFPSVKELNWDNAFAQNPDMFARVLKDILKADQAGPSRPGPRPALEYKRTAKRLNELLSDDYTSEPFHEIFRILANGRSIRSLAAKTGLQKDLVHQLLTGVRRPDVYSIRRVAEAFGKKPRFFLEYRQYYIIAALYTQLERVPEATVGLYKRFEQAGGVKAVG